MKKILRAIILFALSATAFTGCSNIRDVLISPSESQSDKEVTSEPESVSKQESKEPSKAESLKEESSKESQAQESSEKESSADESKEESKSEDKSTESSESQDENSFEESKQISEESNEDDSIFSFKIRLNGTDYKLPFDYDELGQLGYFFDRDGELEPEKYTLGVNPKNEEGNTISAQLWNPTDKVQNYSDCKIGSIEIKLNDGIDVVLPGEFVFDDKITPESVKEQYGEPESEHTSNKYVTLRYKKDLYRTVEFFIYTDESMTDYTSVTIKNFS